MYIETVWCWCLLVCNVFAHWYCHVVNVHISTFKKQLWCAKSTGFQSCRIISTHSAKVNCKFTNKAKVKLISVSLLCSSTCVTNRIHGGKTVSGALWPMASELLFLVSFYLFFVASSLEKSDKRKEPAESVWTWFSFVLTLLYNTPSLVSLTLHTAGGRRGR